MRRFEFPAVDERGEAVIVVSGAESDEEALPFVREALCRWATRR